MSDTLVKVTGTLFGLAVLGYWIAAIALLFAAGEGGYGMLSIVVPPAVILTAFAVSVPLGVVGVILGVVTVVALASS